MSTVDEKRVNDLAEIKANEKIKDYKLHQNIADINEALRKVIGSLPTTLAELRKTIDLLNKSVKDCSDASKLQIDGLKTQLKEISHNFQKVELILEHLNAFPDIPEQVTEDIKHIMIDKNNDTSMLVVLRKQIEELQINLNKNQEEINKKLDIKSTLMQSIGWFVGVLGTLAATLAKLGII